MMHGFNDILLAFGKVEGIKETLTTVPTCQLGLHSSNMSTLVVNIWPVSVLWGACAVQTGLKLVDMPCGVY